VKELLKDIYSIYNAGGDLKDNTTGLYLVEAPQGAAEPFVVYQIISAAPDYYFGGELLEDLLLQFDIISENNSATEAVDLYDDLKAMYDDTNLTVTGYGHVLLSRSRYDLIRHPEDNIWRINVDYDVLLEKT